jgi:transcriptional regulator of acetoin/glycerol metabolism
MREAAAELGVSRATVYRKIGQYGIQLPSRR